VFVLVNDAMYMAQYSVGIPVGQPGIGARETPSDSSIAQAALGPRDRAAPNPVDLASVAVAAFPNRVDLRWQGVTDDVNGTGVYQYTVYRGTTGLWGFMAWEDSISDPGVAAGQSYGTTWKPACRAAW
ncbi:MAG: hypothetical protein KIT09_06090, partial [Bryobacteraceae bacterium]|nr:hypothetical protein [Bryobacteraceae bacterium]